MSRVPAKNGRKAGLRGFTLVELVIVIALLGLVLVLGMPSFTGVLASMRVRSVAEGMLGGIQTARTEAMRRNQQVSFNLDSEDGGGWSVVLDADASVLQLKSAGEGGTVLVQSDLGAALTFNNLGQRTVPAGGAVTYFLSNPDVAPCQPSGVVRCLSIIVQPSGQVRLCDPQRAAPDPQAC
jgi:type IV fimbrial biogenesis protein FimT